LTSNSRNEMNSPKKQQEKSNKQSRRLGQLPPKMEPTWPKGITPTEHANKLKACSKQQETFGRHFCDFKLSAMFAQQKMEHHKHCNVASTRATQLIHVATGHDNFKDIERQQDDDPRVLASMLETHQQGPQHEINALETGQFGISINKFEQGNYLGHSNNRTPRECNRGDGKPKETCPCCLRRGHNVEKGSACWMGAQVKKVIKCNKDNPIQAKQNMENFKAASNPATIAKAQARFPAESKDVEPDSLEMLVSAKCFNAMMNETSVVTLIKLRAMQTTTPSGKTK
jgi:hypothetical protein